jgi:hypothetical protein
MRYGARPCALISTMAWARMADSPPAAPGGDTSSVVVWRDRFILALGEYHTTLLVEALTSDSGA